MRVPPSLPLRPGPVCRHKTHIERGSDCLSRFATRRKLITIAAPGGSTVRETYRPAARTHARRPPPPAESRPGRRHSRRGTRRDDAHRPRSCVRCPGRLVNGPTWAYASHRFVMWSTGPWPHASCAWPRAAHRVERAVTRPHGCTDTRAISVLHLTACPHVIGGAVRSPQREHESEIAAQEMAAQAVRPRPHSRLPAARWDLLVKTTPHGYRDFAPVYLAAVPPSPTRGLTNSSRQSSVHFSSSLRVSLWSRARLARLVRSHTSLCPPVPKSACQLRPCAPASLL